MSKSMFEKTEAMRRIAKSTDRQGLSVYPCYMDESMEAWEREGLVTLGRTSGGIAYAKITDKGRQIAMRDEETN